MNTTPFPPDNQRCRMLDLRGYRCPNKESGAGLCHWHLLVAYAEARDLIEIEYGKQETPAWSS